MNLVRHPVNFVWSGQGQLRDMFAFDLYVLHGTLLLLMKKAESYIFALAEKYELNLCEPRVLGFLGACANLYNLASDVAVPLTAHTVQMEKVTTSPSTFRDVVKYLSEGALHADSELLEQVYQVGPLNAHQGRPARTPHETFAEFEAWQKEAFVYFLNATRLQPSYETYGYDFSFASPDAGQW